MCYTCSPACDNCMPKMLLCPACGERNLLSYDKCHKCHAELAQEEKDKAVAEWHAGRKFSQPSSPPFALRMRLQREKADAVREDGNGERLDGRLAE